MTNDAGFRARYGKGTPAEVDLSEVDWDQSGERAERRGARPTGMTLNRIEDGGLFDPRRPNDFYFLTTEGGDTSSGGRSQRHA